MKSIYSGKKVNCLFCLVLIYMMSSVVGCSSGQCRRDGTLVKPVSDQEANTLTEKQIAEEEVLVAKTDGSLQCGYKIGVTLEDMSKELKGVKVLQAEKKHDGLMRVQTCGAPTGMMNVYLIQRKDVRKAVKVGFKVWQR